MFDPAGGLKCSFRNHHFLPNKALQLTPSRHASLFYDRLHVLRNTYSNHNPRSGQLSLAFGHNMKFLLFAVACSITAFSSLGAEHPIQLDQKSSSSRF